MNIKNEIQRLKEISEANRVFRSAQNVANDALKIINKLEEVIEIQQEALKEIDRDHYDHVMAPVVAMNTLEKVKEILGE